MRELLFNDTRVIVYCTRAIVYWYSSYCLLVASYGLLVNGLLLLVRELLFTGTQVTIYWYARCCLLVRELLFTGTRFTVYWYASNYLLARGLNKKSKSRKGQVFKNKKPPIHIYLLLRSTAGNIGCTEIVLARSRSFQFCHFYLNAQ